MKPGNSAGTIGEFDNRVGDELVLFKECLSEPRFRIKLDDIVSGHIRSAIEQTSDVKFSTGTRVSSGEEVIARLRAYEEAIRPLQTLAVLLGKWSTVEQHPTLANIMARMSDNCAMRSAGNTICISMRWYPLSILAYSAGIAALAAENYSAFAAAHVKRVHAQTCHRGDSTWPVVVPIIEEMLELTRADAWKVLPGYERKHTPQSEYLFDTLRPVLEDLLFLGQSYEEQFDRYEILRALIYADITDGGWAPIGRFGWKHASRTHEGSPYNALRSEAEKQRDKWGPIATGLFQGSYERFNFVATRFEKETMSQASFF